MRTLQKLPAQRHLCSRRRPIRPSARNLPRGRCGRGLLGNAYRLALRNGSQPIQAASSGTHNGTQSAADDFARGGFFRRAQHIRALTLQQLGPGTGAREARDASSKSTGSSRHRPRRGQGRSAAQSATGASQHFR